MRVHVINLERSRDRRAFMQGQLRDLGIDYQFFAAVDASKGQLESVTRYDERAALRWLGHPLQPAEIGCFASHYLLWEQCARSGEPLVVVEDDVVLEPAFVHALALAAQRIEQRRFIRLCGLARRRTRLMEELPGGYRLVRYLKGPRGTQCYAISPDGARALLDGARVWIDAVDLYLDGFWLHGLASYAITPYHVLHEADGSPRSIIGEGRWEVPRPLGRKLRREATHLTYQVRRAWFNLRQRWRERIEQRQHLPAVTGGVAAPHEVSAATLDAIQRDADFSRAQLRAKRQRSIRKRKDALMALWTRWVG